MGDKIARIGVYMYAPIIGGAEQYYRDLVHRLDPKRYSVVAFFKRWDEFSQFLQRDGISVETRPVNVIEPGGHYGRTHTESERRRFFERLRWLKRKLDLRLGHKVGIALGQFLRLLCVPYNIAILAKEFAGHRIQILHIVNGGYPAARSAQAAAIAAKLVGVEVVCMSITNMPIGVYRWWSIAGLLDKCVFRSTDVFFVPSSRVDRALREQYPVDDWKIHTVSYGVTILGNDTSILANARARREASSRTRAKDRVVIGTIANFLPHKGHRLVIEATAAICREGREIELIMVGDGPCLAEMQRLVELNGISHLTTFTGACDVATMRAWLEKMEIFVLASDTEGMPYVIIHAMELGIPVVATAVGGVPDMVQHGVTGFVVPPGDKPGLQRSIITLIEDTHLANEMGYSGRSRYLQKFSVDVMVRAHEAVYRTNYKMRGFRA